MSLFDALQGPDPLPFAPSRKLTLEEVAEIRKLYATGKWGQGYLANRFGVSQPQISKIINRKQWKEPDDHVEEDRRTR